MNDISGISCLPGAGTFYAFPDVSEVIKAKQVADDTALSELLLNEAGVALVPGSAFGASGYLRLSFACGLDTLKDAIDRLRTALA